MATQGESSKRKMAKSDLKGDERKLGESTLAHRKTNRNCARIWHHEDNGRHIVRYIQLTQAKFKIEDKSIGEVHLSTKMARILKTLQNEIE